tara:strand:- start:2 stop:391 length:390 start_codon:yes stop_codon:yes gene_type:complete
MPKQMTEKEFNATKKSLTKLGMLEAVKQMDKDRESGDIEIVDKTPRSGHIDFIADVELKEKLMQITRELSKLSNFEYEVPNQSMLQKGELNKLSKLKKEPTKIIRKSTKYSINIATEPIFLDEKGKEIN